MGNTICNALAPTVCSQERQICVRFVANWKGHESEGCLSSTRALTFSQTAAIVECVNMQMDKSVPDGASQQLPAWYLVPHDDGDWVAPEFRAIAMEDERLTGQDWAHDCHVLLVQGNLASPMEGTPGGDTTGSFCTWHHKELDITVVHATASNCMALLRGQHTNWPNVKSPSSRNRSPRYQASLGVWLTGLKFSPSPHSLWGCRCMYVWISVEG